MCQVCNQLIAKNYFFEDTVQCINASINVIELFNYLFLRYTTGLCTQEPL